MKSSMFLLAILIANICNAQNVAKLVYLLDGDTVKNVENIKIIYKTKIASTQLNELDKINLKRIKNDSIQKIIIVLNRDSLNFFDSETSLPNMQWLTSNNYNCFTNKSNIWQIYVDSFPFELESVKMLNPKKSEKYVSLWIKGCAEELDVLQFKQILQKK